MKASYHVITEGGGGGGGGGGSPGGGVPGRATLGGEGGSPARRAGKIFLARSAEGKIFEFFYPKNPKR